jgi:hypothetical protein
MKKILGVVTSVFALIFAVAISIQAQEAPPKPPDTVILKGNPMGGVKYAHINHDKLVGDKCDTCHHASKPEKPLVGSQYQKCQNCHTKTATKPMITYTKLAFHDASFKKGTCPDCHIKEAAAGKAAPIKCVDCHKKENV